MPDYPLLLNLADRLCVVVGGGPVGRRKMAGLLAAGARVRLIDLQPPPSEWSGRIEIVNRGYRAEDLQGARLVFAATDDNDLNRTIAAEARRQGALVCLPGEPAAGDFTLPAVLRRGELTVTVSTAGGSPALSRLLKEQLGEWLPGYWATVVQILAAARNKHLAEPDRSPYTQQQVDSLLKNGLVEMVADRQADSIDQILKQTLGEGYSLKELAIELPTGSW